MRGGGARSQAAPRSGGAGESGDRPLSRDLRATLEGDVDEARRLLARGFDRIVLRRGEDGHLWAEVRGNLAGLLNIEDTDRLLELVPEEGLEPPRA